MKIKRKIYTFRPYYIDSERLYDMYSAVMDGYSDAQETVEIIRNSTQKNKKLNGTGEFSVTSLAGNGIKGSAFGEWSSAHKSESELQIKSTRKLPPSVLLNWMLDKMENDKRFLETTTRWLHKPIALHLDAIGQPVILKGQISSNSIKTLQKLDVYPRGIKGIIKFIADFFKNDERKKVERRRKYILETRQNYVVDSAFQDVRLNVGLLDDIYRDIQKMEQTQDNIFFSKYLLIREKLEIELEKGNSNIFINTVFSEEFEKNTNKITESITALASEYINRDNSGFENLAIGQIISQLEKIKAAIENYKRALKQNGDNVLPKYGYTFDLCEQMYYNADASDILNTPRINCFGLIKNVGTYMYELEVIALYV